MSGMIDPHIFESPLSLVLAAAFVLSVIVSRNSSVSGFFRSRKLSSILIVLVTVMVATEGVFGGGLYRHWTFIVLTLMIMFSLGSVSMSDWKGKSYYALTSHLGLFLVLFGGLFGSSDCTDVQMTVYSGGGEEHIACDVRGRAVPLPFSVELKDFNIDLYADGRSPKQYTSVLSVDGKELVTSVNHPCRYKGYRIYQSGYDIQTGRYSVLKLVRDPWLPVMALGAILLALSVLLSLKETWRSWKMLVAAFALAAVFTVISVARINFGTLAPALRSLWFVPHLIVYMVAYAVMALAVITGIASLVSHKIPGHLSGRLLRTASSLLLAGMLCGAVWAKMAWGDYWTWDAKECWAAATWLLTLTATHVPKKRFTLLFTIIAFMAIQMTWYGVNYLPSSSQSLHTYNK